MPRNEHSKSRLQKKEIKEFFEEVIQIDRVTRVVKGGRKLRFRATVVIGNKKDKVGIGLGKSNEVTGAIKKAIARAKKDMIVIPLNGTTIPHQVDIKYKSAKIMFKPAGAGTGVKAGGPIRKILDIAGIKDILCKSHGTTNKVNNTKATFRALKMLKPTPIMRYKKAEKEKEKTIQKTVQKSAPNAQAKRAPVKPVTEKAPAKSPATKAPEKK